MLTKGEEVAAVVSIASCDSSTSITGAYDFREATLSISRRESLAARKRQRRALAGCS